MVEDDSIQQVVKAEMMRKGKGKPKFDPICTMYVDLTAETASHSHIMEAIRKQWGEDYTLVLNDGMELEDSTVTRGNS